ncbi:MAG: autotransporter-associated beta strand repeat-containing protein [Verrucomicrobiota bacterium]
MKPRLLTPFAAASLKKCFSPNGLPAAAFCATILSFSASTSLEAAIVPWDGGVGGTGTDIGLGENWNPDGLPNIILGDTGEWTGTPAGALTLSYTNAVYAGAAGNIGLSFSLLGTQTSAINIDSGANIAALRANNLTVAAGAGALSFGNAADTFNITFGGVTNAMTWTNGSSNTVTLGSDVRLANGGAADHTLNIGGSGNWDFNNSMTSTNGGLITLAKTGSGTLNLNGTSVTAGPIAVAGGTVRLTGTYPVAVNATSQISAGTLASSNGILQIDGGTLNANKTAVPSLAAGTVAGSNGFIKLNTGTLTTTSELHLGRAAGAYAALTTGGTLTSGSWLVVGLNNDKAVLNQTAGSITVASNRMTVGAGGVGAVGVVNLAGGTFTSNVGIYVGENGVGTVNFSGTSATMGNLQFAGNASSLAGTVNLLGGSLSTGSITKGPSSAGGVYRMNFNGGTLKPTASNVNFFNSLANTSAYVYGSGALVDTNGFDISIAQPLLTPAASSGVNGITSFTPGAGYIDTPVVVITPGAGDITGVGATAVANVAGGVVTGITITSPGTGYTAVPTFTLSGGGATVAATVTGTAPTANTSGGLVKSGTGTLTLSGTNTYTGATSVSAGKLSVTGSLAAGSAVSVANGATLAGTGTVNGATTVAAGGTIEGGAASTGKLSLTGLTFSGAGNLNIGTLSNYSATSALSAGALTASGGAGGVVIRVASLGTATPGTYKLLDYSSYSGPAGITGFALATLPGRGTGNLVNTGTGINLNLTGLDFLKWTGSSGSAWATGVPNWELNSNGNPASYINSPGDSVVFDDTGSGNPIVDISTGDVTPTSVVFNNTATDYTLQGTNGIAGVTSLVKNGGAAVTINNANTYSGGTTLNGGTLNINNASAIGTGPLTIAGTGSKIDNTSFIPVTLTSNNAQNWNSDFTFSGSSELNLGTGAVALSASRIITTDAGILTAGGIVSGTGFGITKNGEGTLVLGGVNTYSGGTTLNAGTLQLNQTTGEANNGVINLAGGTLVLNPPANNFGYAPTINLSADGTISKIGNFQINFPGTINGNSHALNVSTGAGRFYVNGTTTNGVTQFNVTGGAMGFDLSINNNQGGGAPVQVSNGASLWIAGGATTVTMTNNVTLNGGTGQGATGALFEEGGAALTLSGVVTLASDVSSIGGNNAAGVVSLTGKVTGPGGLAKLGVNKFTLSGANDYTGTTTVNAGTLAAGVATVAGVSGAFGINSAVTFANVAGANLDLAGFATQIGSLTGGGALGGNVILGAAVLTTGADNTSPAAYAGAISGTGGLLKIGTGTQIVSGASSYTGDTVINGGVLAAGRVNNALNPVTSALGNPQNAVRSIIVNSAGTLNFAAGDTFGGANSVILTTLVVNAGGIVTNTVGNFTALGPVTLNGGTLTTAGGAVAGYQSYSLNSDVTVGGSVASTISVTGAGNGFNGVHLGTNTTFNVADVTGSTASDLTISAPLIDRNATFGGTGGLTKSGAGLLVLSGVNAYTGNTSVTGGGLTLADNAQMKFAIGGIGVNNSISGTGAVQLDGDFNLDLTGANLTSGNTWTLVNPTLVENYGSTFTVIGFTKSGNVHTLVDGARTWSFSQASGVLTLNIAGYASWAGTNAGGQASNLDFDNDGVRNGVEYFMGATGSSFTANPGIVNNKVTWPKDPNFSGNYSVQTSPDLGIWSNAPSTVINNNVEYNVPAGQEKFFIRLDVTPN